MRRYRTVILILVLGVLPMGAAVVLGVTVVLPSLNQPDPVSAPVAVVEVEPPPPPEPVIVQVALTAAGPLRPGILLTDGDLVLDKIPDVDLPLPQERYVYADTVEEDEYPAPRELIESLRGYAVRQAIGGGEPIAWAAVVGPDDAQFLATVLEADRVAVSIPVSSANRQARIVSPGNRVDVLLAVEQAGEVVVQTIVEDVRVIAVNSRVIAEADVRLGEQGRTDDDESREAAPARPEVTTVTLEVNPVQGEHLALGAYEGQLSLAIRPHDGAPSRSAEPVQNLRSVLRLPEPVPEPAVDPLPPPAIPVSVRVVRGTSEDTVVFVDDGDGPRLSGAGEPEPAGLVVGAEPATRSARTR